MAYRGPDPKPESLSAVESSNAGDVKVSAENTSNTASSTATVEAKVAGTSAGNPKHTALINGGEQFTWGIDNADGDKFKLSDSSDLGTNDVFEVNSSQILTTTKASYAGSARFKNIGDADYTILNSDGYDIIYAGTTLTATRTITLPTAEDNTGRVLRIKKADSSTFKVTVDGEGAELGDGQASIDLVIQYDFIDLISDGTGWQVLTYNAISKRHLFTASMTGSTSNPSKGSTTFDKAYWWREGSHMIVNWRYRQSGAGSDGSGTYQFDIPNSLTVDTNEVSSSAGVGTDVDIPHGRVGQLTIAGNSSVAYFMQATMIDSNTMQFRDPVNNQSFTSAASVLWSQADLAFHLELRIPISEWANAVPGQA